MNSNLLVARPLSKKDIAQITLKLRKLIGLDNKLYFPVVYFVENIIPIIDKDFVYEISEDNEMKNIYAQYNPTTNTMSIKESVYNNALLDIGRDRFTIAHEIGHYFLHRTGLILNRVNVINEIPYYENPEWQANTFASYILMPNHLINKLSVEQIQNKCKVSKQAATIAKNNSRK